MSYHTAGPPGGAVMQPPAPFNRAPSMLHMFRPLMQKYEISDYFASKLRQLEAFEIVFICDDSGSMNTPVTTPGASPFAPRNTRWEELKNTVHVVTEIATTLDNDGIDIYFLNRGKIENAHDQASIDYAFAAPPAGWTPLGRILRQVLKDKQAVLPEKKLLIIIATDGEPTTDSGQDDSNNVYNILKYERSERVHVEFLICTDDDTVVNLFNRWDDDLKHCDVVDDYASEREQVLKCQGPQFKFSFGCYVCKILLGSVDAEMDGLDEPKPASCYCNIS